MRATRRPKPLMPHATGGSPAGGTPPAHRRRARTRKLSPDASRLHATRQASLAATALDGRNKRDPRDADDTMAFSPPGAEMPQSLRESAEVIRIQSVAGAAPGDAQPPLDAPAYSARHRTWTQLPQLRGQ
jgi:hypothetical protein